MSKSFKYQFSSWTKSNRNNAEVDWATQLQVLNEIVELLTPQLSIKDIIAVIYENVNQLMDAYQFVIGIYDEKEDLIHYKGMIEDGKSLPDFSFSALDEGRLASWCIRNGEDIFMNDFDNEYHHYLTVKPEPLAGISPLAALYTPLNFNEKIVGLVVVRTIHKNAYQPHHLFVLKTVGNFVVRALELKKMLGAPFVQGTGRNKEWRLNNTQELKKNSKAFLSLTEREKEVLLSLVAGMSNKEIAEKLFVSPGTVKTHTLHIYQKMEVVNRSSAILKAVEEGWII